MENGSVSLLRQDLRIKSVHPNPDYDSCIDFLASEAEGIGLKWHRYELVKGKPCLIVTWPGLETSLPSILLNSHTDVVPVFSEHWKHDPFEAFKDDKGNIYARGAQDMKSVGIQYLEAVKRLLKQGKRFRRTIHISFMPDEEIGGFDGMGTFVHSPHFNDLNVGLALDESIPSTGHTGLNLFHCERTNAAVTALISGNPGHGSMFINDTAGVRSHQFIGHMLAFRQEQEQLLRDNPSSLSLGHVTTVNWTMASGGVQRNVLPAEIKLVFDMRISALKEPSEVTGMIRKWAQDIGGIQVTFERFAEDMPAQKPSSLTNHWFNAIKSAVEKHGLSLDPVVCPGRTDACYLRQKGIAAYGLTPMNRTPTLLHDHNEYINEDVFLKGIDIMVDVLSNIATL